MNLDVLSKSGILSLEPKQQLEILLYTQFLKLYDPSILKNIKGVLERGSLVIKFQPPNGWTSHLYERLILYKRDKSGTQELKIKLNKSDFIKNGEDILIDLSFKDNVKSQLKYNYELKPDISLIKKDPKFKSLLELYWEYVKNNQNVNLSRFLKMIKSNPGIDILQTIDDNVCINFENFHNGQMYFIQGPPGTGKTTQIVDLIKRNSETKTFEKIFVCSFLHNALDNVVERLFYDGKNELGYQYYEHYQRNELIYLHRERDINNDSLASYSVSQNGVIESFSDRHSQKTLEFNNYLNAYDEQIQQVRSNGLFSEMNKDNFSLRLKSIVSTENVAGLEKNTDKIKKVLEFSKKFNNLYNDKNIFNKQRLDLTFGKVISDNADVVFTTLNKLDDTIKMKALPSERKIIIIDEASKSTILHYYTLIKHIDENTVVLVIGDTHQLKESIFFNDNGYSRKLEEFLSSKFFASDSFEDIPEIDKINKNYHKEFMDAVIITFRQIYEKRGDYKSFESVKLKKLRKDFNSRTFLQESFYNNLYSAANAKRKVMLPNHYRSCREIFNIFQPVYGKQLLHKKIDNEIFNTYKAVNVKVVKRKNNIKNIGEVSKYIETVLSKVKLDNKIGIISMYNDDCKSLKLNLIQKYPKIEFCTVDSSQGKEYDILFLVVLPNHKGDITKFLQEYNRVNVAISRAKNQLFVIIDEVIAKDTSCLVSLDEDPRTNRLSMDIINRVLESNGV